MFWQLNVGQMKTILRSYFLDNVSVSGSRRRGRREELRLHSAQAQAHAAVSVAQLAAAIAGVMSGCELRRGDGDSSKLGAVLAFAAALVATVCVEVAETAGANRPHVTSAVKTGLESRSSGVDLRVSLRPWGQLPCSHCGRAPVAAPAARDGASPAASSCCRGYGAKPPARGRRLHSRRRRLSRRQSRRPCHSLPCRRSRRHWTRCRLGNEE
jgi:hypothetical protein